MVTPEAAPSGFESIPVIDNSFSSSALMPLLATLVEPLDQVASVMRPTVVVAAPLVLDSTAPKPSV